MFTPVANTPAHFRTKRCWPVPSASVCANWNFEISVHNPLFSLLQGLNWKTSLIFDTWVGFLLPMTMIGYRTTQFDQGPSTLGSSLAHSCFPTCFCSCLWVLLQGHRSVHFAIFFGNLGYHQCNSSFLGSFPSQSCTTHCTLPYPSSSWHRQRMDSPSNGTSFACCQFVHHD